MALLNLEQPDDLDIVSQRGANLNLVLKFSNTLAGSTLIFTVRDSNTESGTEKLSLNVTTFTTQDNADDTVTFTATAQQMAPLTAGNYFYTIQEQFTGRRISTRLKGIFTVQAHAGVSLVL